jgi:flagellar basal body-associated protein FliL
MSTVWTVLIVVGVVVVLCAVVAVSALRIAKSINEDET